MAHPFKGSSKSTSRAKFKALTGKTGRGEGDVDGSQLQPAHKRMADLGTVKGDQSVPRIDKRARGGRTGSKININIISTPGRTQEGPPPLPLAAPLGAAAAPPPGSLPFPAPGGGAPPGGPPMPMKKGGLVKMTGGAEGGLGRLQKAKNARRRRDA